MPEPHRPAQDTLDALLAALDGCAGADLIVFSGGSSVGERDLVVDLVAARGTMIFHGIAVKPGKPTAFAIVDGIPFLGMPGNPTSCLSNAYILLVPYLRAIARLPLYAPKTIRAPLGPDHRLARGPPPVLHGPPAGRRRLSRVQGLRRYHEPLAGGWLHRDSGESVDHSGRNGGRRHAVLTPANLALVLLLEDVSSVQVEGGRGAWI